MCLHYAGSMIGPFLMWLESPRFTKVCDRNASGLVPSSAVRYFIAGNTLCPLMGCILHFMAIFGLYFGFCALVYTMYYLYGPAAPAFAFRLSPVLLILMRYQ
ncbi:hypothetical protein GDO81_018837 [Engystomops pustulosus]|uniref:Uncharacterized protein n=1 Tax=Engystomops pustulosus TaxID=76066 RepID=A0AAV6YVB9_ENGPU|nr:hypothetical protein GDO81_018837 [Engystomops pustulosus]